MVFRFATAYPVAVAAGHLGGLTNLNIFPGQLYFSCEKWFPLFLKGGAMAGSFHFYIEIAASLVQ